MEQWKLDKVRHRCAACEKPFEDEAKVFSLVELDSQDRPTRKDFCEKCCPSGNDELIHWETRYQAPSIKKKRIDFDRLLRLFERWVASVPSGRQPLLYLIALLLVRKRFFRMLELVSEGKQEYLKLKRPGPLGGTLLVPAPLLFPEELPQLRLDLEDLLDGSLEGEVPSSLEESSVDDSDP